MALTACPECGGKVSDKAFACPACGYPIAAPNMAPAKPGSPWAGVVGGVAGTYISAQAFVSVIVGTVLMLCFAAIMIALILR